MEDILWQVLQIIFVIMIGAAAIAAIGLALMVRSLRNIQVPPGADFFTTLRYVPLTLVILLDLLDLGLDMLAAPIAWIVLERMNLRALRDKAAIEALLPFTGPIPTFTLAWLFARVFDLGMPPGSWAAGAAQPVYYELPYRSREPEVIDVTPEYWGDNRNRRA